jgi:uncharacterized protein YdgA (DUF945 family)
VQTQSKHLARLNLKASVEVYEQELYGARAEVRYAEQDSGRSLCRVVHDIRHGPFLFARNAFGLAAIDSSLRAAEGPAMKPLTVAGNASPLTAESLLGFDGSVTSRIASPRVTWSTEELRLSWESLTGKLVGQSDTRQSLSMGFDIPRLEVIRPQEQESYLLEQVEINSSLRQSLEGASGEQTFSLAADELTSRTGSSFGTSLRSLTVTSNGRWSQGMMNSSLDLRFASLQSSAVSVEHGVLQTRLENLDRAALERFLELSRYAERQKDKPSLADLTELQRLAADLLKASPSFEVTRLQLQTGNATVSLQGRLRYAHPPGASISLENEETMLGRLRGTADLAVPEDFAVRIIAVPFTFSALLQPEKHKGLGKGSLDAYAAERARGWLSILRSVGFIEKERGRYTTRASLENGRLAVNGIQVLDLTTR